MKILSILFLALGPVSIPGACDLPCIMDKALAGDGHSAMKMAEEATKTQTPEIVETWYRIAAENGNEQGQVAYAKILVTGSRHRQDCIRAQYWLDRASSLGDAAAKDLAEKLRSGLTAPRGYESGCKGAL